jgi:uncharacterized membrane protein YhaH (DUF805 family)
MNFPTSVKSGFSNYANFKGRASRSEFWWFVLFIQMSQLVAQNVWSTLGSIASLVFFIPNLSLNFRRLHDIGKSAKWLLWPVLSAFGAVISFVLAVVNLGISFSSIDSEQVFNGGSKVLLVFVFAFFISAIVGTIVNFVFLLMPSDSEMNKYGPPPPPTL